jgi:acetoin utilization protein AcuB
MLVGMWMTREVLTVERSDSLARAAQLMALHRFRHLPVVGAHAEGHRLVGIVSATDVVHAVPLATDPFSAAGVDAASAPGASIKVGDVMTPNVLTTTPDAPIEDAVALMRERKIGALPVMRSAELVGLITESDVLRAFVDMFAVADAGARITFDVAAGEDVLPLIATLVTKHRLRLTSLITLPQGNGGRHYCVIRVVGSSVDPLLDDLWKSKHRVESVIRRCGGDE